VLTCTTTSRVTAGSVLARRAAKPLPWRCAASAKSSKATRSARGACRASAPVAGADADREQLAIVPTKAPTRARPSGADAPADQPELI